MRTGSLDDVRNLGGNVAICSMTIKLHRILALALLCLGLLVTGAQAVACCESSSPTQDCCPNRSDPSGSSYFETARHSNLQGCCAVGAQIVVSAASDITSNKTDLQPTPVQPLVSLIFLAALAATDSTARLDFPSSLPSHFPPPSPLFLRTRRLRL
jgi:hypothetical protein